MLNWNILILIENIWINNMKDWFWLMKDYLAKGHKPSHKQAILDLEDACSELTHNFPELINVPGPINRVHTTLHKVRYILQREE